ncbi:putative gustatory receptor 57a [Episyrphus balteatus]|uniref:putative gustatory receptor 57a n=1 Tax=Episyrphus balteatus TaxID=286459 RepID=UPI0024860FB8|nr:putative gustatory receptor 57a [Episyrphus balteatus]
MARSKKPCRSDCFRKTNLMDLYSFSAPIGIVLCLVMGTFIIRTSPKYTKYFEEMDNVLMFVIFMNLTLAVVSFLYNMITMQGKNNEHLRIYEHLEKIDAKLVHEFHANMHYEKIALKISVVFYVFLTYGNVVNIVVISYWSQGNLKTVYLITFCHTFMLSGMHMIVYSFMTVADLIRIRFRLLQKLLNPGYLQRHYSDSDVRAYKLTRAIEIYRELYRVIDELNSVYGFCLLSCLAHDFTLATSLFFLMFGQAASLDEVDGKHLSFVFLLLLPPAYKMFMMPIYCTMSLNEGKKCMRIIKLMDDAFPGNERIRRIVADALWWNNHNKDSKYKIGFMMTANTGLITIMTSAIMNYVAILIQFQIQEEILKV